MFKSLVLSGGGIKGCSLVGALSILEERDLLKGIETVVGSSVGGLIGALFCLGYSTKDMAKLLVELDFEKYMEYDFTNFFTHLGLVSGDSFMNLVKGLIKKRGFDKDITFKQLYEILGKRLVLTGANLTKADIVYFHHETTPDMSIADAIRITISYPLFFRPCKYLGDILIDGALFEPYPMNFLSKEEQEEAIGFLIDNESVFNPDYVVENEINDFVSFTKTLIKTIQNRYVKLICQNNFQRTIGIDLSQFNSMNFSENTQNRQIMYQKGREACENGLSGFEKPVRTG